MGEANPSGLFSVFLLSIYTLVLLPCTIYHAFFSGQEDVVVQPWEKGKKKLSISARLWKLVTKANLVYLALWGLWVVMLLWVQASIHEQKPFDPFEILGLDASATDKDIKRAYRKLSLMYHPDKNPDPSAAEYFASFVSKAYMSLTDEVSRTNYEKYGHPDGPQAMNIGVALPNFMFSDDRRVAPLVLLGLVTFGILLPLGIACWYMLNTKNLGPNGVMQETLHIYLASQYKVKESQSLVRIPETLVVAMEFIQLPTPVEQAPAIEELRKSLCRVCPDLKEKAPFWRRKPSILKVHMLLLAYLERGGVAVPPSLHQDLQYALQKSPALLEEMFTIASLPRPPTYNGWLTPSVAVVEMIQCLSQAIPVSTRKPQGKPSDPSALLLQLPHMDSEVARKLKRARGPVTCKELQALDAQERGAALQQAGLSASQAEDVSTFLSVVPTVYAQAHCDMDGEDEIMEQEVASCKVRVLLTRPSHKQPGFAFKSKGKTVRAYTPMFPFPKDENWYLILADPSTNSVLGSTKVSLLEAEAEACKQPTAVDAMLSAPVCKDKAGKKASKEVGQYVEFKFVSPAKAGKYELQLLLMCDAYVGSDRAVPIRLHITPMSRAAQEGRDARSLAKAQQWASDDESETGGPKEKGGGAGSGGESDEEEEAASDYDYDSDETGELESGSDGDADEGEGEGKKKAAPAAAAAASGKKKGEPPGPKAGAAASGAQQPPKAAAQELSAAKAETKPAEQQPQQQPAAAQEPSAERVAPPQQLVVELD